MIAWDWKYRIFFDDCIRHEMDSKKIVLTSDELEIFEIGLRFYQSFYSFGILFDLIVENPKIAEVYVKKALNNQDKIIKTPDILFRYYLKKIDSINITTSIKDKLIALLKVSLSGKEILSEFWKYVNDIFGDCFGEIVSNFKDSNYSSRMRVPRQRIIRRDCRELFYSIYKNLVNDERLIAKYGTSNIQDYTVKITEGVGYGEWWDHEISLSGKDELILFTNDSKVKADDYLYTIIHETYPGHGHFYASVRNKNLFFDQGAMMLVEGWATFCEWNTYPSKYIDATRHNALATLYNSYFKDVNEIADIIRAENRRRHIPQKVFIKKIINQTQYIGFIESYYLGALWIENIVRAGKYTSRSLLTMLQGKNKGEFFRLWT